MNRYGPTQCATNLATCPKDEKNAGTDTIEFIFHKDRKKTGGKPMLEQSVTSDHRKQRLKEKDTLKEEIL